MGKGQPADPSQHSDRSERPSRLARVGKGIGKLTVIGKNHPMLQDYSAYMVDQHKNKCKQF